LGINRFRNLFGVYDGLHEWLSGDFVFIDGNEWSWRVWSSVKDCFNGLHTL
jgi:hypothetical protein